MTEVLDNFFFENLFKEKIYYFDIVEIIQHAGCITKIGDVTVAGTRNDIVLNENKLCKVKSITFQKL